MLHPHTQLVKLVPLLGQSHCAVLCVPMHHNTLMYIY